MNMMYENKRVELMIQYILQHFDWEGTLKMMNVVDWKYGLPGRSVGLNDIIDTADGLLRCIIENDDDRFIERGGFRACRHDYTNELTGKPDFSLELLFVGNVWSSDSLYDNYDLTPMNEL